MRDDYLWDKSGQPDPEIEQLEELLGNLRYRRPASGLPLSARSPVQTRRSMFTPFLAVAAAVLLMITAAGLWLTLGGSQKESARALASVVEEGRLPDWLNAESMSALNVQTATNDADEPEQKIVTTTNSGPEKPRRSPSLKLRESSVALVAKAPQQALRERISEDEGVAAREQLIKALHLTSSKLNQVQRKVRDNKTDGPVS